MSDLPSGPSPAPAPERAKAFLDAHFAESVRLVRLARVARCSLFFLIRAFFRTYRCTPHQYQLRRRIDRAQVLLATSRLSVTDVCFEVGFQSLGTFSRRFRAATGWAPSAYRARTQAQNARPAAFIPDCFVRQFRLPV